jgi:hypothetical protein
MNRTTLGVLVLAILVVLGLAIFGCDSSPSPTPQTVSGEWHCRDAIFKRGWYTQVTCNYKQRLEVTSKEFICRCIQTDGGAP